MIMFVSVKQICFLLNDCEYKLLLLEIVFYEKLQVLNISNSYGLEGKTIPSLGTGYHSEVLVLYH